MARLMALAATVGALYFGGAALISQELQAADNVVHNVRAQLNSVTTNISNGVSALQTNEVMQSHANPGG